MAGFTPGVERVGPLRDQTRVVRGGEITGNFPMAFRAGFRTRIFGSGNRRKHNHGTIDGTTGNQGKEQGRRGKDNKQAALPRAAAFSDSVGHSMADRCR